MVLLASTYDKSQFFKAADLDGEKKFRIKKRDGRGGRARSREGEEARRLVHQRRARPGAQQVPTTAPFAAPSAMTAPAGPARSSSCFRRWLNSAARWCRRCGCASRRRSRPRSVTATTADAVRQWRGCRSRSRARRRARSRDVGEADCKIRRRHADELDDEIPW